MLFLVAYPSKPVSHGVSTPGNLDTNSGFSNSASLSTLNLFGVVILGIGCFYSACSLLAAGAFVLQDAKANATGVLLAIFFMVSNTVAANGFLIISVVSQAMTTVALGEPCALSIRSLYGQALVFLGLGTTRIFSTDSVLVTIRMTSITDLSSVVLAYLAFWWPFMDYYAIAAGQLSVLLIMYRMRLRSKIVAREGSLGLGSAFNEEETPLLISR